MENNSIDLKTLSKNQLINLIISLGNNNNKSEITFFDIRISSNEPLLNCEQTLNRIIDKNKSFLESKQNKFRNPLVTPPYVLEEE